MANYKWPNVYANITDLSGVVATNSVTSCGYVGEAEFGPINKPTFLSTLKDYTSKFGALNSAKYGYAGYSLAVASESIDSHYFVRTVKAGKEGEHAADDAMYASIKIPAKQSAVKASGFGWYVEEIDTVEKTEDSSILFNNRESYIKDFEIAGDGIGYTVNDELIARLDMAPATFKVTELKNEYTVIDAAVVPGFEGEGYINGEQLIISLDNTNAIGYAIVADEDESGTTGELIGIQLTTGGISSTLITNPIEITSETGHGAVIQLTMTNTGKIKSLEMLSAGKSSIKELPEVIGLEGGTGTGAGLLLTLTNLDLDDVLCFVADNPNNLQLGVRLTDSTINENKAYAFSTADYVKIGDEESITYLATLHDVNEKVLDGLEPGDMITISRASNDLQEGNFTVDSIDGSDVSFTYVSKNAPMTTSGKVSKYPRPNERTFQVDVYLTKGKLTQNVETYQFCTLYQNKDAYGNSTYIEDVINGSSDYIKVYVNPNLLASLDEGEVLEPALVTVLDNATALVGGQSGGKPTSNDLNSGWELFNDRTQTNVSLLLNSGYTNAGETSYQNAMLKVAEYRRDCFCLFDIPMTNVDPDDAIDWRKNVLGTTSYRAALSAPWVRTYDSVQGRANFVMCPSAFLAKLIGAAGDPWHAPAGPNRGIISSSTVSPTGLTQAYDSVIGGTLYADNQINCIVRDVAAGYVNWGQRTLQAKPSALDRINVARTVIYIETILRDAARWHLFENNTAYERMQITLQFSAFLDTILSADGIAAYKVICDTSNNTPIVIANNQLVIDVILTPVYAAESIILNTTITGADASVDVSSSAG